MAERLDRNGYAKSVLPTVDGVCYLCGNHTETIRHEVYYGTANRKVSKQSGTWVNICPRCHEKVHRNPNAGIDLLLKRKGEYFYSIADGNTHAGFMRTFGRSWL